MPQGLVFFSVLVSWTMLFSLAYGQTYWTWQNPLPQGNTLRGVTWAGNQAVAVGNRGAVVTSPDGILWTAQPSIDTLENLNSVAWTGSLLVAVGWKAVYTSPTGRDWTKRDQDSDLKSVIWTGTQLVAVGLGAAFTSPDGLTWSGHPVTHSLHGVAWGDGQLVAVGNQGSVVTSPDGITWTSRYTPANQDLLSITWTGSQFVAVGEDLTILTSPNGRTWTRRAGGTAETWGSWYSVTWTGSLVIAVGIGGAISTSPDGVAWTGRGIPSDNLYSVAWTGSQAIHVGMGGTIRTSPTGETWTHRTPGNAGGLSALVWTGSEFVGASHTSPDGITWRERPSGDPTWSAVTWTDSLLVGMSGARIYLSRDGIVWKQRNSPVNETFSQVIWNGSMILAVGRNGAIISSPDGGTWTRQVSGTAHYLMSVVWTGKRFVAVGYQGLWDGSVLVSEDGISWKSQGSGCALFSVAWNGSRLVAVGRASNGACALTSTDGEEWTTVETGLTGVLSKVAWAEGKFVAVHTLGLATSPDGMAWTRSKFLTDNYVALNLAGDRLLATGNNATVLTSPIDSKVAAPRLVSPPGGAIDLPIANLPVTWTRNAAALRYHIQVSANSLFTKIIREDSTLTDTALSLTGLDLFKSYYWRVRSKNSQGTSPWTLFRRFRTMPPPPPAPVLSSPGDDANSVQLPARLEWHGMNTAYGFRMQVSTDSNFAGAFVIDSALADTQWIARTLAYTTAYYWRIRAENTAGNSPWSSRRFKTSIPPPVTPELKGPPNFLKEQLDSLTFVWSRVPDAETYHLWITVSSQSSSTFLADSTLTDTSRSVSGLEFSTSFVWRVRAKNAGGVSAWTSPRNFSTIYLPLAPLLFFPFQNVDEIPDSLPLVWRKLYRATAYHVQLAKDTGFTDIFMQDSAVTDTGCFARGKPDGTYYWRVRGGNLGGWGPFSERWMFKVSSPTALLGEAVPVSFRLDYGRGRLRYSLPEKCHVRLVYFDINGGLVGSFVNSVQGPGEYSLAFPPKPLKNGMHIQVFRAGPYVRKNRVMILE